MTGHPAYNPRLPLPSGSRVGSYEIIGPLGKGGMGEVYRARDAKLHRDVAIKTLPEIFAADPDRIVRFEREARVLAALNHPNIAQVYAVIDDPPALIMEIVEGEDLAQRLSRGRIPLDETLTIAKGVVDALVAAHERGIVHRDLKPANVKLGPGGTVKVLDFGLAKVADEVTVASLGTADFANSPTITSPAMTEMGVILGTAAYMAPEQARGATIDRRADIWAFGVLLYEMLSGRPPFHGASATDIIAGVLKDAPDWTALPPTVPPALRRVLARCLVKDPKGRLHDIADVRFDLDEASAGSPAEHRTVDRPRGVSTLMLAAAMILTAITVGLLSWAFRSEVTPSGSVRRATIPLPGFSDTRGFTFPASLSEDGSTLVVVTPDRSAGASLFVRSLESLDVKPVDGTFGGLAPFVSRDGRKIGFARDGSLYSVSVTGGPVVQAKNSGHLAEGMPAWLPDGRIVFTSPSGGLVAMQPDGSSRHTLTEPSPGERHLSPRPLPDGRAVLFSAVGGDVTRSRIFIVPTNGGSTRELVGEGASTPQYSDGFLVYAMSDGRLMAAPFDAERGQITGAPSGLPDRVSRTRFGVASFALGRGVLVYVPPALTRLVEVGRGGQRQTIESSPRLWHHPRYSRDGNHILADVTGPDGDRDVWIVDRAQALSRVTRIGDAHDPSWLPDARSISFLSFRSDGGPLMMVAADGSSAPSPIRVSGGFAPADLLNPGGWLRDGSAYVGSVKDRGAPGDIWMIPRAGGMPERVVASPADELGPAASPNGEWLAYQSDETGRMEIYIRRIRGGTGRVLISNRGGTEAVWDPSGRILYYLETDRDRTRLISVSLNLTAGMAPLQRNVVLADVGLEQSDNHANYDIHPDGSRFIIPEINRQLGLVAVFDWARSFTPR